MSPGNCHACKPPFFLKGRNCVDRAECGGKDYEDVETRQCRDHTAPTFLRCPKSQKRYAWGHQNGTVVDWATVEAVDDVDNNVTVAVSGLLVVVVAAVKFGLIPLSCKTALIVQHWLSFQPFSKTKTTHHEGTFPLTFTSTGEAEEKMLEYDASTPEGADKIVSKINSILRTRFAEGSRRVSRDVGLATSGRSAAPAPSTGTMIQRRLSGMLWRTSSSDIHGIDNVGMRQLKIICISRHAASLCVYPHFLYQGDDIHKRQLYQLCYAGLV